MLYNICCYCAVLSHVQLFSTPWTVAHQAPLSMGFPRQEYCSGLPFPPPGALSNSGIKPTSLLSPSFLCQLGSTCIYVIYVCKSHMYM